IAPWCIAAWLSASSMIRSSVRSSTRVLSLLSGPGAHGALRSFPTRRSSDLDRHFRRFCDSASALDLPEPDPQLWVGFGQIQRRRSEEHTSELQSRFDLVCRLLLEKKNKERREECLAHREAGQGGHAASPQRR